jgi:hypothetical protein
MQLTPEQLELVRRASGLSLDAEGDLLHEGAPIAHPGLHGLFQRGLDVTERGEAIVRIGAQWAYVRTAGTPFVVQRLRADADGLELALNTERVVRLAWPDVHWTLAGEHELRVDLPEPGHVARLGRRAWHAIADDLDVADDGGIWLTLAGRRLAVHPV